MRTKLLKTFVLGVAFGVAGCETTDLLVPSGGAGGSSPSASGGNSANTSGGASTGTEATGGSGSGSTAAGGAATGGKAAVGGAATGGTSTGVGGAATGGKAAVGGAATGGTSTGVGGAATGGKAAVGGAAIGLGGATTGGKAAVGGAATGGTSTGIGGATTGGKAAVGGAATGGAATAGATSTTPGLDCSTIPAMPTGGTLHSGNSQGGKDNLAWQIWSNGGSGSLTTFSTPAFIASWNNSGDYLGRMGFEWGTAGKAFTAYGDITADLAFKKNGTGGQYSYVGIYGWSTNPCIEWYIVDDSYSAMPFNTGTAPSGTADLDGGTYNLVKRNTTGTGGNRCGNVTAWDQFYSIRKTGRQCGTISVSEHFKTWDAKGWKLGNLLEVKILVEAASGVGSVDFMVANVKKTL